MSQQRRRRSRALQGGYTLVELMMALALFTVAMLGIISLQKITVVSNAHAKNTAMAERIAQAWAGQLEMDATAWQSAFGTGFLNNAAAWQRPDYQARGFGAAFDALGNPLSDSTSDLARAQFCTQVRMSWLYPPTLAVGGNATLRAEIRVYWLRDGATALDSNASMCAKAPSVAQVQAIGLSTDVYYFVYQTVGVRQHSQI